MRTDLALRAALPVAALVALVLGAPRPLTGGLTLLGLVVAVDLLVSSRRRGAVDRALLDVGGVLVALVLTGMLLGSTPVGLDPTTWVVGLAVVTLGSLVVAVVLPSRPATDATAGGTSDRRTAGRQALLLAPWVAVAAVVVGVSVSMSAASLEATDVPPVELSIGDVDGTRVEVVVSSGEAVGPLEVRTSTATEEVSYPLVEIPADGTQTVTVTLPTTGRQTVTVGQPDQTTPLRTLVLDR